MISRSYKDPKQFYMPQAIDKRRMSKTISGASIWQAPVEKSSEAQGLIRDYVTSLNDRDIILAQ